MINLNNNFERVHHRPQAALADVLNIQGFTPVE
jgi:hypothetical protein